MPRPPAPQIAQLPLDAHRQLVRLGTDKSGSDPAACRSLRLAEIRAKEVLTTEAIRDGQYRFRGSWARILSLSDPQLAASRAAL